MKERTSVGGVVAAEGAAGLGHLPALLALLLHEELRGGGGRQRVGVSVVALE